MFAFPEQALLQIHLTSTVKFFCKDLLLSVSLAKFHVIGRFPQTPNTKVFHTVQ